MWWTPEKLELCGPLVPELFTFWDSTSRPGFPRRTQGETGPTGTLVHCWLVSLRAEWSGHRCHKHWAAHVKTRLGDHMPVKERPTPWGWPAACWQKRCFFRHRAACSLHYGSPSKLNCLFYDTPNLQINQKVFNNLILSPLFQNHGFPFICWWRKHWWTCLKSVIFFCIMSHFRDNFPSAVFKQTENF